MLRGQKLSALRCVQQLELNCNPSRSERRGNSPQCEPRPIRALCPNLEAGSEGIYGDVEGWMVGRERGLAHFPLVWLHDTVVIYGPAWRPEGCGLNGAVGDVALAGAADPGSGNISSSICSIYKPSH
eukprot:superscaffoldBa00000867_g7704